MLSAVAVNEPHIWRACLHCIGDLAQWEQLDRRHLEAVERIDVRGEAAVPALLDDVIDAQRAARGDNREELRRPHVAKEARWRGRLRRLGKARAVSLRLDVEWPRHWVGAIHDSVLWCAALVAHRVLRLEHRAGDVEAMATERFDAAAGRQRVPAVAHLWRRVRRVEVREQRRILRCPHAHVATAQHALFARRYLGVAILGRPRAGGRAGEEFGALLGHG